ncbi:MAG: hypothetical protein AMXMBFR7_25660 [Planctomycetota bacterium]
MQSKIERAIRKKLKVEFQYGSAKRECNPHVLGMQNKNLMVLCWQTGGRSTSGSLPDWRLFKLSEISRLKVLEDKFTPTRSGGRTYKWESVLASVT